MLHYALAVKCPFVLVEALLEIFPDQVSQPVHLFSFILPTLGRLPLHIALESGLGESVRLLATKYPEALEITDPVTGLLPIQHAILNASKDGSLANIDAVDALLTIDPPVDFLIRCMLRNGGHEEQVRLLSLSIRLQQCYGMTLAQVRWLLSYSDPNYFIYA